MKDYSFIKEIYKGLLTKRKKSYANQIAGNRTTAYFKRLTFGMLFLLLLGSAILACPGSAAASAQVSTGVWTTVTAGNAPANPFSIAADLEGNLFVTNGSDVYELASGGSNWTKLPATGCSPDSITVRGDGSNDEVYVTDSNHSVVKMVQYANNTWGDWKNIGGITPTQVWVPATLTLYDIGQFHEGSRFPFQIQYTAGHWATENTNNGELFGPLGLAVDNSGNVYVANQGSIDYPFTYYESVEKYSNGNWSIIGNEYNNDLCYVNSVAVDQSGSVYVTTQSSPGLGGINGIAKWNGSSWSNVTGSGADTLSPSGIVVDIWGGIYVIDTSDNTVKELPAGSTQWKTLMSTNGPGPASGIAVDGSGNVYVTLLTDAGTVVKELQAPATQLVWVTQPGNGKAGNPWASPPAVALEDACGNVETGDSTDTVTLTLNNGGTATLTGATATLVNGVATFSSLAVSQVGSGYTLTPSCSLSGGLDAPASNSFNIASPSPPAVTGVSPTSGVGGTTVTVTGSNLMGASAVMFGSVAGTNLNVVSNTQLTVTAPTEPAGQVSVTVTTPGGTSSAVQFIFMPPGAWVGTWTIIGSQPGNFSSAMGMAVDGSDNIYIADRNGGYVDKYSGGTWSGVMPCTDPEGVAVDGSGDYYVADGGGQKIWKDGAVWHDFSADLHTAPWWGFNPNGVAVDKNGNVYAAGNNAGSCFIVKWDHNTQTWSNITGSGVNFSIPNGVAVDGAGNVYVVDYYLAAVAKLPNGSTQWTTIGSGLNHPSGVIVDGSYNIFVADQDNNIVREWPIGGSGWTTVGSGLYHPWGVAVDQNGNVYTTEINLDTGGYAVAKHLPPFTQLVWLNQPGGGNAGQPLAGQTSSAYPALALEDAHGNVETGDSSDTVTLTLGNANGATLGGTTTVTFFNGIAYFDNLTVSQPGSGYTLTPSLPGGLTGVTLNTGNSFSVASAPAQPPAMTWAGDWGLPIGEANYYTNAFHYAGWVAVDQSGGNVYVTDSSLGTLNEWSGGGWFTKWTITNSNPQGVAVDGSGNYYVALNSKSQVLKNLTVIGDFNTDYSDPWCGLYPNGVAVDQNGNVYVTGNNGANYVLKWNGSTWSDITYHGGNFSYLRGVAVDGSGNVYVADSNHGTVEELPAGTTQWRIIGSGFSSPWGVTVDGAGNVYVTASSYAYVLRAGGSTWNPLPKILGGSNGVAVDQYGNVYVVNGSNAYKHQAPATKLVWMTQPGGGAAGQAWGLSQQPVVALEDANGNLESNSTDTVTLGLTNAGGVSISGNTTALSNGEAAFSSLAIRQAGISFTLTASCLGLVSNPGSPFNITPGTASKLVVGASSSQKAGTPFGVMVTAEDQYGNTITDYTGTVHFSTDDNGPASLLPQDYTFTAGDAGTHIFTGVTLDKAVTATSLTVADTGNSNITGSLQNIQITAGPANTANSTVVASVSSVSANGTESSTITVTLLDAYDNPVSGKTVSLAGQLDGGQTSQSVITAVYGTSRTDGTAVFTVADTVSEKVTYIAEDTTDSMTITQQPTVEFTPTVTFDPQGGSPVASIYNVTSGSTISAPTDPTWPGRTFVGWYKESSCTNAWNFSTDTVTGNVTLYAKWTDAKYTVIIGSLAGGSINADPTSATSGTAISLTITPNTGKQLKAKTLEYNDGTTNHLISGTSFIMPAVNVTVSAEFEAIPPTTYSVSIDTLAGGSINADPTSATSGTAISLTITPDTGMQLKVDTLKYNDGTTDYPISGTSFIMPAVNVTVSAEFEAIPPTTYSVSIGTLTGGSIKANPTSATSGTAISLTITPDTGKQLKAGTLKYNDGTTDYPISGTSFTMPAVNVTVSAQFEAIPPTPTLTALTLSGTIPNLTVVQAVYDLNKLNLNGTDQYGNPISLNGQTVQWNLASGNSYASLSGNTLTPMAAGSGTVTASVGGVTSNPLGFTVLAAPSPAPVLQSAATDNSGMQILLTFNKAMAAPGGSAGAFSVSVNRNTQSLSENVTQAELGSNVRQLMLSLSQPLLAGDTVSISYTPGTLASADGGILAEFTSQTVTNQAPQPLPISAGHTDVTVSSGQTNLAITPDTISSAGNNPVSITVPSGVNGTTVNVAGLLQTPSSGTVTSSTLPALNIYANVDLTSNGNPPVNVQVQIPQGTTVSAPQGWNGTINVPTVQAVSSVTVPSTGSNSTTVDSVIEIGYGDVPLTFNHAVRILIPGQAGKNAGYVRMGTFYPITTVLSADDQSTADNTLGAGKDGYIDVGSDLVIWTKHFTKFVTYTGVASVQFNQGSQYAAGAYDVNAPQPTAFNWTRQSGYTGSAVGHLQWTFATGDIVYSSPAVGADGTIYAGSFDNKLYALNPDGSLKWSYATGAPIASSPAIGADGTVYFGSADSKLYALKPDGTFKWAYTTGAPIASSPAIGADGTIYVGSGDNKFYAIKADGSLNWSYTTGAPVDSSPAVSTGSAIYVGSDDNNLYAFKPDGSLKWSYTTGAPIASSPAIGADGTVYAGSGDGKLYALKPDGTFKWSYATGAPISSSPAIGSDGTVYVGSYDNNLYAFNSDGSLKWLYATGAPINSSPAIGADGTVYVGSWDNKLYAIKSDGSLKWSYAAGEPIASTPAIGANGTIYAGSYDGKLYAVGSMTLDTESLLSGITSVPYSTTLTASGGVVPYTWSAGGLPAGLNINSVTGEVYGTPTAAGTFTVRLTVADSVYAYSSKDLRLTINSPNQDHGGGGGSYTPSPASITITGSVIDGSTGAKVSSFPASVTSSNGTDTITMDAGQTIITEEPDGTTSPLSISKAAITTAAGTPVKISADGTIQVENLARGTDSNFNIMYDLGSEQKIKIATMEIKIDGNGNVTLTIFLIDHPYGIITDATTGKALAGVKVTLYYADTARDKAAGKTPDTVVALPGITGFKPNNNQDPQTSDVNGAYGFMIFPDTDYYIVAAKDGYAQYTSPTISVDQEIVHWDFKMSPVISGVTRLEGQNRVDTALTIAQAEYPGQIENVVLATEDNYPDALAGSVLAYKKNAPILLVGSSEADQAKVLSYMKSKLDRSGTVYILGGESAVSVDVETQIQAAGFKNITRIAGSDRYETSAKIADQLGVKTGTPVVLVSGDNYPDALSVSSVAAQMQIPILLVQNDGLSNSTSQEIAAIKPRKVYIIGGEGVISPAVENQVAQLTGLAQANIVRIGGADRYATSLDVAQYFNLSGQNVCVATGNNFPDALAGSVYAAKCNAPIILADGNLPDQFINYLKSKKLTGATIFGGESAVSKGIEQQLGRLVGNKE